MGLIQRQASYNLVITYLGAALGAVNNLLLFRLLLTQEQFGLVQLITSLATLFAQFASFGLLNTITRYFPHYRSADRNHRGVVAWFLLVALAGFVLLVSIYLLGRPWIMGYYAKESPLFLNYYGDVVWLSFFMLAFNLAEAVMSVVFRTVFAAFLREIVLRLWAAIGLVAVGFAGVGFKYYMQWYLAGFAVVALLQLAEIVRSRSFRWTVKPLVPWVERQEMLGYGAYSFFAGVALVVVMQLDKVMLPSYHGLAIVGIYTVYANMGIFVQLPARALGRIARPLLAEAWMRNDRPAIASLYSRTSLLQLAAGALIFVGIWVNKGNLIAVLHLSPAYAANFAIYVWVGFSYLVDMTAGLNALIIATSHRYRWDIGFSLGFVVLHVLLNIWLIPLYGGLGAAVALAVAFLLMNLLKWYFVLVVFGMQPFHWRHAAVLGVAAGAFAIGWYMPLLGSPWLDLSLRSFAVAALYGGLIYLLKLLPDANELATKLLVRLGFKH